MWLHSALCIIKSSTTVKVASYRIAYIRWYRSSIMKIMMYSLFNVIIYIKAEGEFFPLVYFETFIPGWNPLTKESQCIYNISIFMGLGYRPSSCWRRIRRFMDSICKGWQCPRVSRNSTGWGKKQVEKHSAVSLLTGF